MSKYIHKQGSIWVLTDVDPNPYPVHPGKFWCGTCQCWFDDEQAFRSHLEHYMMTNETIDYDIQYQKTQWPVAKAM